MAAGRSVLRAAALGRLANRAEFEERAEQARAAFQQLERQGEGAATGEQHESPRQAPPVSADLLSELLTIPEMESRIIQ